MRRIDWAALPTQVRQAIEEQAGEASSADPVAAGNHSDIAAVLTCGTGRVFIKGLRTVDGPELQSMRREAAIGPYVQPYAPRLLWEVEAGGWLVLAFEYVNGRHADYSPGSPDLDRVAKVIAEFQAMPCPEAITIPVERRWKGLIDDLSPMAGDNVIHADINPANVLITPDERVYVVDWALTSRGAAWVELAIIIQWLISAGHTPVQAEAWVSQFPSWQATEPTVVNRLAWANATLWQHTAANTGLPWAADIAEWTQQWAAHRRSGQ